MRLILSSVFFFFLITCLSASGQKIYATYDIRVSGIKIGKLNWIAQLNNDSFSNEMILNSEGLLSGLYSFEGQYLSEGEINNQELTKSKEELGAKVNYLEKREQELKNQLEQKQIELSEKSELIDKATAKIENLLGSIDIDA